MTGAAYSIAALVFILAASSALLPAKYDNALDFVTKIINDDMFDRNANRATHQDENEMKKHTEKDDEPIKNR
ncbi:hypothetical protein [Hydrogenophilus thiooxidans]|uniref:hypothetical protein n=1 Tax=Hydrogenophilus thiooxidans TaxID=2820326 RepID=UPI001C242868|nr:hypothetical protein [Hydrogenophilus thiooxidans]